MRREDARSGALVGTRTAAAHHRPTPSRREAGERSPPQPTDPGQGSHRRRGRGSRRRTPPHPHRTPSRSN